MQGPKNIRVNCLSAGPVNTLAARGIGGFLVGRRCQNTASTRKMRVGSRPPAGYLGLCMMRLQELSKVAAERAPLRRNPSADEVSPQAVLGLQALALLMIEVVWNATQVAKSAVFLASDMASGITGQTIYGKYRTEGLRAANLSRASCITG